MPSRPRTRAPAALLAAPAALVALLALLAGGCSEDATSPQTGRVEGRVVLNLTSDPLAGVALTCAGAQQVSAADGRFLFPEVPLGDHQVSAELAGYRPWTATVKVTASVNLQVALTPEDSTSDVSGRVYHLRDGDVPYARVRCGDREDITDTEGLYLLPDVPLGRRRVLVDHAMYDTLELDLVVARPVQTSDLRVWRSLTLSVPVTRDAELRTGIGERENNYGDAARLAVSLPRQIMALIGMPDLQADAAQMQIESAELRLWVMRENPEEDIDLLSCFQVFRVIGPWTEMTVSGAHPPEIADAAPVLDFTTPNCWGPLPIDQWVPMDLAFSSSA